MKETGEYQYTRIPDHKVARIKELADRMGKDYLARRVGKPVRNPAWRDLTDPAREGFTGALHDAWTFLPFAAAFATGLLVGWALTL